MREPHAPSRPPSAHASLRPARAPPMAMGLALALALAILAPALHAGLEDFAYGLPADIRIDSPRLDHSPTLINGSVDIRNGGPNDWTVYLLYQSEGGWETQRMLGLVQGGTAQTIPLDFEAEYNGTTFARHHYAIVAVGDDVPLGRYFDVVEDWTSYKETTEEAVRQAGLVFVPLAGGALIALLIVLAEMGYTRRPAEGRGEYSIRSLFLPTLRGRPFGEVMADLMLHPIAWAVELLALVGMAYLMLASVGPGGAVGGATLMALTFFGAALMPMVYLAMAWLFNEQVERMPLRFMASAFTWGVAAALLALLGNSLLAQAVLKSFSPDATVLVLITTVLIAPLVEELVKGWGLLVLHNHHEVSSTLHGMHLGFAVGLGFSFVENWFYMASKTGPLDSGLVAWAGLMLYRSFFNSIAHGCFSAALGGALGWAKGRKWGALSNLAFVPALLSAAVLHSIFNLTAVVDGFIAFSVEFPVYRFNPAMAITLMAITTMMFLSAMVERRRKVAPVPKGHEPSA